jgi:hypothetical protein
MSWTSRKSLELITAGSFSVPPCPQPDDYDIPEGTEDSDEEEFTVFSPVRQTKPDVS